MPETKRGLAVILSADVADYKQLAGDNERATVRKLRDCRVLAIAKQRNGSAHLAG